MREAELRKHTVCGLCKQKVLKTGIPLFWVLKIERHGVKLDAVKRQTGLAMVMGGSAELAGIMGPDEEMTQPMMEPLTLTLCEDCAVCEMRPIAALAEIEPASTDDERE